MRSVLIAALLATLYVTTPFAQSWTGAIVGPGNTMRFTYETGPPEVPSVGRGVFILGPEGGAALFYQTQSPPSTLGYILSMAITVVDATLAKNGTVASVAVAKRHPGFDEPFPIPDVPGALPAFRLYLHKSDNAVLLICVIGDGEGSTVWMHQAATGVTYISKTTYDIVRQQAHWKVNGVIVGSVALVPANPQNIGARIIGASSSSTVRGMGWLAENVSWQEIVP